MQLEDFLEQIEKTEKARERAIKARKVSLLRRLEAKFKSMNLLFLGSLITKISNKVEYYYGIFYERYYEMKYKRAIIRLKILAGLIQVVRERGREPQLIELYEEERGEYRWVTGKK
jgi:hypothetical protein